MADQDDTNDKHEPNVDWLQAKSSRLSSAKNKQK